MAHSVKCTVTLVFPVARGLGVCLVSSEALGFASAETRKRSLTPMHILLLFHIAFLLAFLEGQALLTLLSIVFATRRHWTCFRLLLFGSLQQHFLPWSEG